MTILVEKEYFTLIFMSLLRPFLLSCILMLWASSLKAQNDEQPDLGGTDQVDNRLELDRYIQHSTFQLSFLDGYFAFKDSLKARTGFSFGLDYSSQAYWSNSLEGTSNASSGIVRFYGSWELVGRKSGNLAYLRWTT